MIPFVIGALVGAAAVVAVNKNDKIKEQLSDGAKRLKSVASESASKIKEKTQDVKESAILKIDSLGSTKETEEVKKDD